MNIKDVLLLYEYNYWANKQILGASANVSQKQFETPASFPFGGLRGTLFHVMESEWAWRTFFQNDNWDAPDLDSLEFPNFVSLQERWIQEEKEMRMYLATLSDEDLNTHRYYTTNEGDARDRVLWHCLVHVVNHGTQHRSEAAALLTEYGCSPGDLDFTRFLNEYKP